MNGAAPVLDIRTLRDMSLSSMDVMTKAMQRLKELRPQFASNPMLLDRIEGEISTVDLEIRIATIVHTRLQAAAVSVKPLNASDVARLNQLAAAIDDAITTDAIVSASLDDVEDVVATAGELRDLVKSSTNVPV